MTRLVCTICLSLIVGVSLAATTKLNHYRLFTITSSQHHTIIINTNKPLAPILAACLGPAIKQDKFNMSQEQFEQKCTIPYINGSWLDTKLFLRTNAMLAQQAQDKLIIHPSRQAFPVFYPANLKSVIAQPLATLAKDSGGNLVVKPLPQPLPTPSLSTSCAIFQPT
jgi:trehalose utilization protein